MSQLFDALKRNRRASPSPEHVERTARADAVLATLGYRKTRRVSPSQRAALLGVCGLAVALVVAWALWPVKRLARRGPPLPGRQPASVGATAFGHSRARAARDHAGRACASPPALTQAPPAAPVPPRRACTARDVQPAAPSAPLRMPPGGRPSPPPADVPPPPAPRAEAPNPPPAVPSAELFRLALYYHRAGDLVTAETQLSCAAPAQRARSAGPQQPRPPLSRQGARRRIDPRVPARADHQSAVRHGAEQPRRRPDERRPPGRCRGGIPARAGAGPAKRRRGA